MSIKIMNMVADRIVGKTDKKPNGNQTEKNLLMAMANYASDNGEGIWASNQCLADRAGVSRETATRTVKSLKDKGLIERIGIKKYGMTHTVIYRMDLTVLYHLDLTETAKNHLERMAVSDVTEDHNASVSDVTEDHNASVSDVTEDHNASVSDVTEDHNASVSDVTEDHNASVSDVTEDHNASVSDVTEDHNASVSDVTEDHNASVSDVTEDHNASVSDVTEDHNASVSDVTEDHNASVSDVTEDHNASVSDVTEDHNASVSDVTEDHNASERCDARDVSDVTERHTNRHRNHIYNISLNARARAREGDRHLVDRIREAYDELSDKHNLPGIKVFGDSRKRLIRARLKDAGGNEDLLFEVMHKVADSDYCRGLVNGWKADFNFIFSPEGFPKILEGKYDNDRNIRNPKGNRPNFRTSKASAIRARERDKRHQAARKLDAELGFN